MRRDGPELVRAVEAAMARLAEAGEIARLTARWAG
jgi:ABC-type amino acid transport substrate-binding protein